MPASRSSPARKRLRSPVTQHLSRSRFSLFLFDPTLDRAFRRVYRPASPGDSAEAMSVPAGRKPCCLRRLPHPPRPGTAAECASQPPPYRRAHQVRCLVWLAGPAAEEGSLGENRSNQRSGCRSIARCSREMRALLRKACPEIVQAAEDFAEDVTYVPVGLLGRHPPRLPLRQTGGAAMRYSAAMGRRPHVVRPVSLHERTCACPEAARESERATSGRSAFGRHVVVVAATSLTGRSFAFHGSRTLLHLGSPRFVTGQERLLHRGGDAPDGAAMMERLESLSNYRPLFPPHHPQASLNPVTQAHLRISVGGRTASLLSRIGPPDSITRAAPICSRITLFWSRGNNRRVDRLGCFNKPPSGWMASGKASRAIRNRVRCRAAMSSRGRVESGSA